MLQLVIGLGIVALLALAGWMFTLAKLSQALLPMANALKVCQQIVKQEDDKVASLAERVLRKREPQRPTPEPGRRPEPSDVANPMSEVFGPRAFMPISEQPDSESLEVAEA